MDNSVRVLFEANNVISLRTVYVLDDGRDVTFSINPALRSPPTTNIHKVEYGEWLKSCFVYLYRHTKSFAEEHGSAANSCSADRDVRQMTFKEPPRFNVLWTDSGNSVALFLNGEPWAFFDEETCRGYSKGILNAAAGNVWEHNLFKKTFGPYL